MTVISRYFPAITLMVLVLVACNAEPPPMQARAPAAVTVVTLNTQAVTLSRQLPGRTSAYVIAEVRPQVTGIVKERLFAEGSQVKAGQPLYQLDDATYRAEWNSAKASLARAQAMLDIARLNAKRAAELIKGHSISQQDYDNAVAAQREAEADVGVAQAQVASTAVKLGYARITSPIDGHIGKSTVTQGALVTADQAAALTTVQQLDPMYVDLTRSASELLQLRRELSSGAARSTEDGPVSVFLEDGTRYAHDGQLTFADVTVDPMTGSYALRVLVPNPDHLLMPGMYVRALISSAVLDHGLLVPQRGVARNAQGNASAMVVTAGGTVELRAVEVSRTVGDQWLVSSGLVEGDRVIVQGLQKIQPGMPVIASEESAAENVPATGGAEAEDSTGASAATAATSQDRG